MSKILYDIEQLLSAKGKETGICRVSLEVLKELSSRPEHNVYPLVTVKSKIAEEYLHSKGLDKLVDNLVYLPYLKKTTKKYNWRQKLKSSILIKLLKKHYTKELEKYDEYISIFSPLSDIVYNSKIKTKIFVQDLIPVKFPQLCSPDFAMKYNVWMERVKTDEVICISQSTKKDFLEKRPDFDEKKVKVTYLAADNKFKPTQNSAIKEKYGIKTDKYFLAVSELTERKNFEHLIEAFLLFLEKTGCQDVTLAIVGVKRTGYEQLNRLVASKEQYKDRIILTGYVADEDMPALYTEAVIFIYPSLYEGFGLPVLEAMQCGTAVICSDNSSLPEVGGEAVKYISGRDLEETANALALLYSNKELRDELAQKGLSRSKQFAWKKTVDEIFN